MSELEQEYQIARDTLFETLKVYDTTVDGDHKPQLINSSDWTELEHSPGVYIKNVNLIRPDSFVISLLHGSKGSKGENHSVKDTLEIHCVTGSVRINGIEFKARDTWKIPAGTIYNFEYLEDTYLTIKFIPKNIHNFQIYAPVIESIE